MTTTHALPTGTITFLFTDIEGSTKLWENQPEAMRVTLLRHDTLMKTAIVDAGGVVFKTIGDAFCAAFANAPNALDAAASAQSALQKEVWPLESPILVRMALHTGTVEERDNDYFGPVLNRVARLLSAGHGGQTLVSAATYELVRDHLPNGVGLQDLGSHRLKDLDRPEHVFQVTLPGLMDAFAPLQTLDNTPNNLPQQVTSFIGREKVLGDVQALLAKTRLLTLTASGGSGKTRLSLQVAAEVLNAYPDGAWLIELAPLADAALVPQTVASVLGVKEQAGQTLTQTLTEHLKNKRLLLVLDNCEHVLPACAQLTATLLRACPGVRVLATSREPLGIAGEQTYRVPSLSLPDPKAARAATPESVSQFEAVRLFIERAQAVKPDFAVTNANAPALAQLCFRLDGIPLALELAAARVRSLAIEQINDKLDTRFRLLTGGDKSALPRQQTLRALVGWSYDLLSDTEKTLFARLSIFAGGWTLEAAESVCGWESVEEWEVLDLLTSLSDKSLVFVEEVEGATRYGMLETLRQYGAEKRDASGETEAVQNRHINYFVAFAEAAEPKLLGPEQAAWLTRLETEHDNLRTALTFCTMAPPSGEPESFCLRLAGALCRFWEVRGYLAEGREYLTKVLVRDAERSGSHSRTTVAAKAFNAAGNIAHAQGDFDAARSAFAQSLAICRELSDKRGITIALNNLGNVAHDQGNYEAARTLHGESLAVKRELGDKSGIAISLNNLALIAYEQNDYKTAQSLFEESLGIKRELGDKRGIAIALNNLGTIVYAQGDATRSRALHEESLGLKRALGDKNGIAHSLAGLAALAYDQGNFDAAQTLHEESLVLRRELGDKSGIALSLEGLAEVLFHASQTKKAVVLWGAAHAFRERIGAPASPNDQAELNKRIKQARAALSDGDGVFSAAWNEGRALNMEQAVEFALKNHAE